MATQYPNKLQKTLLEASECDIRLSHNAGIKQPPIPCITERTDKELSPPYPEQRRKRRRVHPKTVSETPGKRRSRISSRNTKAGSQLLSHKDSRLSVSPEPEIDGIPSVRLASVSDCDDNGDVSILGTAASSDLIERLSRISCPFFPLLLFSAAPSFRCPLFPALCPAFHLEPS